MGRAGAGGYATVQHAYDTRLKRDVAIKCIQISQTDLVRAKESAAKADDYLARDEGFDFDAAQGGFVPLTAKISEPSFLSSREKVQERRRNRHSFLDNGVKGGNAARRPARAADAHPIDALSPAFPAKGNKGASDAPMDLSDFAAYSNLKKPGAAPRKKGRLAVDENKSFTIGLSEFAGNIPGRIKGAGEAHIGGIDDVVNVEGVKLEATPVKRTHDRPARDADDYSPRLKHIFDLDDEQEVPRRESHGDPIAELGRIPGLEEARTAAHLNDANIVTVYDCVVEGDMAYVIMEYVEGKTLARIMRDLGNDITLDIVASVFVSVSHALEVAHNAGVLHLDIKPENVIVNGDGVVKVTDFGLSALMDASGQGETGGGTIGYMPLEQMRQQRLDVRTDEWALASLTYEMLSGKNPFKARTLNDAEAAIEGAELVIPSLCWEDIDESVDDIMFDALSPDMEGRYPSIKAFSDDLTPILGDTREGKKQLAVAVKDADALHGTAEASPSRPTKPSKPHVPFIDKLGVRGSSLVMRAVSVLDMAMLVVIALMNFRFAFGNNASVEGAQGATPAMSAGADTTFGLFSTVPVAAWAILLLACALAAFRPRWAFPVGYLLMVVMLFFNQAWLPAFLLLLLAGAWWWFYGRTSDLGCTLAASQPLFGSVGFAAIVPVVTGAIMDVREALMTVAMAVVSALIFASFGSGSIMNWEVMANFIVAVNPTIAGASISNGFMETMSNLANWCMIASWLAAAFVYSLLCRRGTHVFDVLGSVACGVLIMAGVLLIPLVTADFSTLTPLVVCGAIVSALLGVVLAVLNVPDRVRMAPGEW